jgi:two-component system CheB/CheR fusion protein
LRHSSYIKQQLMPPTSTDTQEPGPAESAEPTARQEPGASPELKFPVVGIGASAGGLEALEALVKRLASGTMSYVVLQHLAPGHESVLTEILSRDTPIKVVTIRDQLELEVNGIYVTPPGSNVAIEHGVLRLLPSAGSAPRQSIDAFFRSLAADRGPAAIGVVLSGAGTDGTIGLREIKREGGITFAQDPSTAGQAGMPQSALDAGVADFCLSPSEIGDELMRLGAHPFVARRRPVPLFAPESTQQIFQRLKAMYGVDFSAYKQSTIERRMARRMTLAKLQLINEYIKFLDENHGELAILYSDLLLGVTAFFRDRAPFDYLKEVVFPRLLAVPSMHPSIRIWIAGCATGEEAYSIAICLLEALGARAARPRIQIFATDLDDEALSVGRLGISPKAIELDVSTERLQRFFTRVEHGYQVSQQLRDLIVFAHHNLGKDPPFSRMDLVSCRNVLIYMQLALQRRVLRVLHYALNHDGFLLLGTSETIGDAADLFSIVDRRVTLYQKKTSPSPAVFDFRFGAHPEREPPRAPAAPASDHRPVISIQQLADRKVIEKYAPPGVLLNEQLEVIQFRGQTGPFFAPAPGTATFNVFKLARPELAPELRATIQQAITEGLPASSGEIPAWDRELGPITVDVVPVHDAAAKRTCLLVSFRHTASAPASPAPDSPPAVAPPRPAHADDLARELMVTQEYLQATVQELQSANKELQSTNEELETSKEELQSTNEELATVNDELQHRMTQLATSNDDLQNLLANLSTVVMLVGSDLKIRRFSTTAGKILNMIPGDIGRSVSYLDSVLRPTQVEQAVSETIHEMTVKEQRVRTAEGTWYTMRTSPYRTAEHAVRGAVIELTRMMPARKGDVPEVSEIEGRVLSALPFALALFDPQLRITYANKRFFEAFQLGAEILGIPLDEVWAEDPEHEAFWQALQGTSATGAAFQDLRVPHPFGRAHLPEVHCAGYRVPAEGDRAALTMLAISEAPPGG